MATPTPLAEPPIAAAPLAKTPTAPTDEPVAVDKTYKDAHAHPAEAKPARSGDDLDGLVNGSASTERTGTIALGNLGTIGHGYGAGAGGYGLAVGGRAAGATKVSSSGYAVGGLVAGEAVANDESYAHHGDLGFKDPAKEPLSTFSADVDTASYSNVRRMLLASSAPPVDAVRVEELVNYAHYHDTPPTDGTPIVAHLEVGACPWDDTHRLLRIGVKAKEIDLSQRPKSNLVFLIDTSGSMDQPNKLPLLVRSLELLVEKLDARDRVSIVTYAGSAGVSLYPTPGDQHAKIWSALEALRSGGSTNGADGIKTAYDLASKSEVQGINRVILATDGDFNVGMSSDDALTGLIKKEAKRGIALSVLGFGMGNYKDSKMETLADHGDGNYAYVDTLAEARRVLVEQMTGTLVTVAKDVKLQLELDPKQVASYRQIGYEDRQLAAKDFADDRVDAGDVGAGHVVVALYEIAPRVPSGSLATVNIRYKPPTGGASSLLSFKAPEVSANPSSDFTLSAGIAEFGMLLRSSKLRGNATWDRALALVSAGGHDDQRKELATLIDLARRVVVAIR